MHELLINGQRAAAPMINSSHVVEQTDLWCLTIWFGRLDTDKQFDHNWIVIQGCGHCKQNGHNTQYYLYIGNIIGPQNWLGWQIKCNKRRRLQFFRAFSENTLKKSESILQVLNKTPRDWHIDRLGAVALKCTASKPRMVHWVSYDQPVTHTIIHWGMMVDGLLEV